MRKNEPMKAFLILLSLFSCQKIPETLDDECYGLLPTDHLEEDVILTANNLSLLSSNNDEDCDGVLTNDDCDDNDPTLGSKWNDQDCDRSVTNDDCDDNNPNMGDQRDDQDCDGVTTEDDCDDTNPEINDNAYDIPDDGIDQDCDGLLSGEDQPITGLYAPCLESEDCLQSDSCLVFTIDGIVFDGFCTDNCVEDSECEPSPGGTAIPTCFQEACLLVCENGESCPNGMECTAISNGTSTCI